MKYLLIIFISIIGCDIAKCREDCHSTNEYQTYLNKCLDTASELNNCLRKADYKFCGKCYERYSAEKE